MPIGKPGQELVKISGFVNIKGERKAPNRNDGWGLDQVNGIDPLVPPDQPGNRFHPLGHGRHYYIFQNIFVSAEMLILHQVLILVGCSESLPGPQ
jgi:hypothetical protein